MGIEIVKECYGVNVGDFGARGDGLSDDSAAIQTALNSGSPLIIIPAGNYKIGKTLRVNSGTTVKAHPQAIIYLANGAGTDVKVFLLTNSDHSNGNNNIVIQGGIWDGNNEHNERGKDGDRSSYTGVAINFINVDHLEIKNLTVRNPDSFSIRLGEVNDFLVENITLDHPVSRLNQDGVHVGGFSQRGVIRGIKAITKNTPNDDMVALNADDDVERALNLGMKRGPIKDVQIENLSAAEAYTFVRILSVKEAVENINIRGIRGGCRYFVLNMNNWRFPVGVGNISRVTLRDVRVRKTDPSNGNALIRIALRANEVRIADFFRKPEDITAAPSVSIENAGENRIVMDGLDEKQVQGLMGASHGLTGKIWKLAPADHKISYHGEFLTNCSGNLVVKHGGIKQLFLESINIG